IIVERTTRRFSISVVRSSFSNDARRDQSPTYGGFGSCALSPVWTPIAPSTVDFSRRSSICRASVARLRARLERTSLLLGFGRAIADRWIVVGSERLADRSRSVHSLSVHPFGQAHRVVRRVD